MNFLKTPQQMLMEDAGMTPASPGMLHTPRQMLLHESGAMPKMAEGGQPQQQMSPEDMMALMLAYGQTPQKLAGGGKIGNLAKFLAQSKIPQRLYHGTTASEEKGAKALSQLKQSKEGALGSGVYMTPNPEFAGMYANQPGGYIMPVHANMRNPLEIHTKSGVEGNGDPMKLALIQLGVPEAKADQILEKAYDTRGYVGKEVMSRAQKQGYDGIAQYRDGELSEVVSYNPMGVKSAIGNTGEFDPYDPRLSKAEGGHISANDMLAEMMAYNQAPQYFAQGGTANSREFEAALESAKRQPGFLKKGASKVSGAAGKLFNRLNPAFQVMAAEDAGSRALDAAERAYQGDYRGAAISGLGAVGSGVAIAPGFVPQIVSIPLTMGADYLQEYFDEKDPHKSRASLKTQN
jgi:hypothetical protein